MITKWYGCIDVPEEIDITDPCYGEDVWCRINRFPMIPGKYKCYAVFADNNETDGWGNRIARIGLKKPFSQADYFERKGMVGVDSGMAGFFICDNRKVYEELMWDKDDLVYGGKDYFFSNAGYGDGGYDLYAGYENGKIVEIYIDFIPKEELEPTED